MNSDLINKYKESLHAINREEMSIDNCFKKMQPSI